MADTVAEFINNANITLSSLQAGLSIVTNSASETAVIRDLLITNPANKKLSFTIGQTEIFTNAQSARYSGSEIVGAGNSLTVKTALKEYYNGLYYAVANSGMQKVNATTLFDGESYSVTTATAANTALTTTSVTMNYIFFDQSGNFYYHNGSTATLYRRAGGVNGAQTSIPFGAYGICYDGVRYIYGFTSSNIFTYDTQTSTVSNVAIVAAMDYAPDNTTTAGALDGRVIVRGNYTGTTLYFLNPATGAATGTLTTNSFGINGASTIPILKDLAGNYYVFSLDAGGNQMAAICIGSSISAPSQISSVMLPFTPTVNNIINKSDCVRPAGNTVMNRFYVGTSSGLWAFNLNSMSFEQIHNSAVGNAGLFVPQVDSSVAATHFGTIAMRATGIKTT